MIVGQEEVIAEILTAFLAGGHCLLRGVPGLAKTLLIKTLAEAVHLKFSRIQFTPDLMPSDIIGTEVIEEDRATGRARIRFIAGPIFANIILADEINRTPPKTQAALLEAMQEYQVTVGGVRHDARPAVLRAGDAEPDRAGGHVSAARGAARSLHAQRRHRLSVGGGRAARSWRRRRRRDDPEVTAVATGEEIERARLLVREVPAADNVIDYAARLVRATRPSGGDGEAAPDFVQQWVRWGAGPRAGQSLLLAGKARAVLQGRPAVSLDDVRAVAPPVLASPHAGELPGRGRRHRRRDGRHAHCSTLSARSPSARRPVVCHVAPARRHVLGTSVAARPRTADARRRSKVFGRDCIAARSTATAPSSASIGTIVPATT